MSTSGFRERGSSARSGLRLQVEPLEERWLLSKGVTNVLLDFGTGSSPREPRAVQVPLRSYTASRGYGWESLAGLTAHDRGGPNALTRDFHAGRAGTFLVDVPDGTYDVTAF